ncbi:MAG: hypothetical protein ACPG31_01215 [Planctomycetota bacterium]
MNSQPENHEPSRQTIQDLRALGGVQAPEELWQRVQDERNLRALGAVSAPKELWSQVQNELGAPQEAPVTADPAPAGKVLRPSFLSRRWAAAAAVVVLSGIALLSESPKSGVSSVDTDLVLAQATPESERRAYQAKLNFVDGDPSEMSLVAKGLAASLGGLMVEDDA